MFPLGLLSKQIKGSIHVGACRAEELPFYISHKILKVCWVEANPVMASIVKDKTQYYGEMFTGQFAATAQSGGTLSLNIANNGASSSIYDFGIHKVNHPEVYFTETINVQCLTVDDWLDSLKLNREEYNLLVYDIQGAELDAMKGSFVQLSHVDFVFTEVSDQYVYKNQPLMSEIDLYLKQNHNLVRIFTNMTDHGWGDALYCKRHILHVRIFIFIASLIYKTRKSLKTILKIF